jgi:hypothetical protein
MPELRTKKHDLMAQRMAATGDSAPDAHEHVYGNKNPKRAYDIASDDKFQARLAEIKKPAFEETILATSLEVAHVVQKMSARAFYNPGDFYSTLDTGKAKFKPLSDLTPDQLQALDCQTIVAADGSERHRFRLADKDKALDQLGRYLAMFQDTVVVENVFKVIQEMPDDELDRRIRELESALEGEDAFNTLAGAGSTAKH